MPNPAELYHLLADSVTALGSVDEVLIGRHWTLCRAGGTGLAATPAVEAGVRPWHGRLSGRPLPELASWVHSWQRLQAAVGLAAINAALQQRPAPPLHPQAVVKGRGATAAVFDWFRPQLRGAQVVTVGSLPGVAASPGIELRRLGADNGALEPAGEHYLPRADWVFVADHTIVDKTLPRILELAAEAQVVLMGPGVPWLPGLAEFGVDYLVGIGFDEPGDVRGTVAEGGDLGALDTHLHYRIAVLTERQQLPRNGCRRDYAFA